MISPDVRLAIVALHENGLSPTEIAFRFKVDRKTVASIIKAQGKFIPNKRKDVVELDENTLRETFTSCSGWIQRVHEVLDEKGIKIGYSTLTRRVRELGLGEVKNERAEKVPDSPGAEFQHDTSPYTLEIGGVKLKVNASQIYYRYSKRRYLKFYVSFNRWAMKCFFHEALTHFGFVPKLCVIDNTNLAVLRGTGKEAIFNSEMENFGKIYGFSWLAHEVRHSDRKGGVERGFWTVETNFFPGRKFASLDDLNAQAFNWCEKHSKKPNDKTKLIPLEVFDFERPYMEKILPHIQAPYLIHHRTVDQYGYICFNGNYYWIPKGTEKEVVALQYAHSLQIYSYKKIVGDYELPGPDVKGQRFSPKGLVPAHRPKKVAMPTGQEETELRSLGKEVEAYLEELVKSTSFNRKYQMIRALYALKCRLAPTIFLRAITRSLKYQLYDVSRLETIAVYILRSENLELPEFDLTIEQNKSESYLEGEVTDAPDLSFYETKYGGKDGQET